MFIPEEKPLPTARVVTVKLNDGPYTYTARENEAIVECWRVTMPERRHAMALLLGLAPHESDGPWLPHYCVIESNMEWEQKTIAHLSLDSARAEMFRQLLANGAFSITRIFPEPTP